MDSELIVKLILYVPTGIFCFIAFYGFIRGLMRGMKKSFVALINMIISITICIVISRCVSSNTILSVSNNYFDTGITSLADSIENMFASSNIIVTSSSIDAIGAYAEMVVRLVVFLICLLTVYYIVRFILFLVYLIFFRRKIVEYNEDNGKKALIGGLIGLVRGAIMGFLVFSQFSTLYCIVAGGVFYDVDEYQDVIVNDNVWEYNDYYKALKTSRSSGLGSFFDGLAGDDGTALDYLLIDFVASSSYKDLNGDKVTINLREELCGITGVAAALIDNGVLVYTNNEFTINTDNLTEDIIIQIVNSIGGMKTITDVIPTILVDIINNNTDFYIDTELLLELDLANDFKEVANIIAQIFTILNFGADDMFEGVDWLDLDPEVVDSIIDSISNITILTKVLLPLGSQYLMDALASDDSFLTDVIFDFNSILWDKEIQNLKGLYELIIKLDWDVLMSDELDIFEDIFANEEMLAIVDDIIQQVFNSDLIFGITKTILSTYVVAIFDESEEFSDLEIDFSDYEKVHLQEDVSILLNVIVDGSSLFEIFSSDDFSTDDIFSIDVTPVRNMLVGYTNEQNVYVKGFFDLNILSCMDIDTILSITISNAFGDDVDLPYVESWKIEIGYLFDLISAVQNANLDFTALSEGDYSSLSSLSDETTEAIVDAMVLSTIFSSIMVSSLSSIETFDIPAGIDWYGTDGELHALLTAVFHLIKLDVLDILTEGDISTLFSSITTNDFDILLNSVILHSTVSSMLVEISEENASIVIPAEAYDTTGITTGMISKGEIINLIDVVLNLGLDFETLSFDDIQLFSDSNIAAMLNSLIMSRSLVGIIETSLGESISIPELGEDWYNEEKELSKLLYAFQALLGKDATMSSLTDFVFEIETIQKNSIVIFDSIVFNIMLSEIISSIDMIEIPYDVQTIKYGSMSIDSTELSKLLDSLVLLGLDDLDADIDLNNIFSETLNYNELLDSFILLATISKTLEDSGSFNNVPSELKEYGYISKTELVSMLNAIRIIGVTSLDSMDLDISNILSKISTVLESDLLWIAVSDMLLTQDGISIPDSVQTTVYGTTVITKVELTTLCGILADIGIDSFDDLNLETLLNHDADKLMASVILAAILSDLLVDSGALNIPSSTMENGYIKQEELVNLLKAIQELDITDMDNLDVSIDVLNNKDMVIILDSVILRNTISDAILDSGLTIVFEYNGNTVIENISEIKGEYEYILTATEITTFLDSLSIIGCNSYGEATISFDTLRNITDDELNILLSSSIMCVLLNELATDYSAGDTTSVNKYDGGTIELLTHNDLIGGITTIRAL